MSSNHTPGPWSPGTSENHTNYIEAADPLMRGNENLVAIAEVFEICDDSQHEANAHLIAAAPELLEACERAEWWLTTIEGSEAIRSFLRTAIAKAEGK